MGKKRKAAPQPELPLGDRAQPAAESPTRPVAGRYMLGALLRQMLKLPTKDRHAALMTLGFKLSEITRVCKTFNGVLYHTKRRLVLQEADLSGEF